MQPPLPAPRPTAPSPTRPAAPAPRKLTRAQETLRRLGPADLRLAAGGFRSCICQA